MTSFVDQIRDMVDNTEKALIGVVRAAIQDVVNDAQQAGPSVASPDAGKGGRMPVDTGFLRSSGQSSLEGWPVGPTKGRGRIEGEAGVLYATPDNYSVTIGADLGSLKIGDTFYFGWTADYAVTMNVRYGFMDAAVQGWKGYVAAHAHDARVRMERSKT